MSNLANNIDPDHLISGHLDGSLTGDEQRTLNDWVKEDPAHARKLALAVMLDDRIQLQYHAMKVTLQEFGSAQVATAHRPRSSRRIAIAASAVCLLLMVLLYTVAPFRGGPSDEVLETFHELVVLGRKPADCTYRITFVNEDEDQSGVVGKSPKNAGATNNEKMLYVRDGRNFVCTWIAPVGGLFVTGSNEQESWSIPPGGPIARQSPMHFTGGLPSSGEHLAPILSLYEHQEKTMANAYNLELRKKSKTTGSIVAGKKPDTQIGPRRIEIDFDVATRQLTEMRIWPETPDHRRMNFTRIELVSSESLDPSFFTPDFHHRPAVEIPSAAD